MHGSFSTRDVCASATTGSGKTAAFMLPILERLLYRPKKVAVTRVMVITPTRYVTKPTKYMETDGVTSDTSLVLQSSYRFRGVFARPKHQIIKSSNAKEKLLVMGTLL